MKNSKTTRRSLAVLALGFLWASAAQGAMQQRPNVVFILADDLGLGGLNCFGTDWLETPNIDRLCHEGMKCTGGLAPYPTCKPSRAAILTGQYGPRTSVYRVVDRHKGKEDKIRYHVPPNGEVLPDKVLMNQPFKQVGYATAMYGKWHISNESNPEKHPLKYGFDEAIESHGLHYKAKINPPMEVPAETAVGEALTDKAIAFMDSSVKKGQPFFLYMPYFWVHGPVDADPELIAYFEKKLNGVDLIGTRTAEVPTIAAMTKMLDEQVGRLLAALKDLGVEDDTIIVFTSDNGSYNANFTGSYRGRKGDTYEGGMRVPYIFKWNGQIKSGSDTAERIIGVDLYPTLLSLAGLPQPENHPLDGCDFAPLLLGQTQKLPDREVYCYFPKYAGFSKKTERWSQSWRNVLYSGNSKLTEYPEYDEYELYNLNEDPQEKKDLAKAIPEKTELLKSKLHRWMKGIGAPEMKLNPDYSLTK